MRRYLVASLISLVAGLSLAAQGLEPLAPLPPLPPLPGLGSTTAIDHSQIGFNLFSGWVDNYQRDATRAKFVGSTILYGTGSLAAAGAIATWLKGDEISEAIVGEPMESSLRQNITLGLGIGAGALYLGGIIVSTVPIKDYRSIYADVYNEKDPEVREAMAVSVLRYQADQGRERRITSFVTGFAVPIVASIVTSSIYAAQNKSWSEGFWSALQGSTWSMAGSVVVLFQKTPEERLYERYLSARDALYGSSR